MSDEPLSRKDEDYDSDLVKELGGPPCFLRIEDLITGYGKKQIINGVDLEVRPPMKSWH